jgi:primosomal protein N' (replication factor Y)
VNIAKVIVNLSLDKIFDYLIPNELIEQVKVGVQVEVPFSRTKKLGYVLECTDNSKFEEDKLKKIISVSPTHPPIPPKLIELGEWIAEYYCATREQAIKTLMPSAVRKGEIAPKIISEYYINQQFNISEYIEKYKKKRKARCSILKVLKRERKMYAPMLLSKANCSRSALTSLIKEGAVLEKKVEIKDSLMERVKVVSSKPLTLNSEQRLALEKINTILHKLSKNEKTKHTILLHGITGSGKTEVYLQAIGEVLKEGKEIIVLVPEICLTAQCVERFRGRFGDNVSVLHSGLSD